VRCVAPDLGRKLFDRPSEGDEIGVVTRCVFEIVATFGPDEADGGVADEDPGEVAGHDGGAGALVRAKGFDTC